MSPLRVLACLLTTAAFAAPAWAPGLGTPGPSLDVAVVCTPPVWFPPIVVGAVCTPSPGGPPTIPPSLPPIPPGGIPTIPGAPPVPLHAVQAGSVVAFNLPACPDGWVALEPARGRYLVGLAAGGALGAAVGLPLGAQENRATSRHTHAVIDPGHSHTYTPAVATSTQSGGSQAGYAWQTTSREPSGIGLAAYGVAGTNAPYVQALVCQATAPVAALAPGALLFFDAPFCPPGWLPSEALLGRSIVGVHLSGTLGARVGAALADRENRPTGGHTHSVTDPGHAHSYFGVVYASTNSGSSQAGVDTSARTSTDPTGISIAPAGSVAGTNAPYLQLLACEAALPWWFVPDGAVLHANLAACPSGWTEFAAAQGRYLVGLPAGGTLGAAVGSALGPQEDRALGVHTHTVSDPGHHHGYNKAIHTSSGGGSSKAGVGSPTRTSTDPTGITLGLAGSVDGTNAPYLALRVCRA